MKLKFTGYFLFSILVLMLACTTQMYSQWSPEVQLSDTGYSSYSVNRCIAANGNFIHVIYYQDRLGEGYEIFYRRSTTGGTTWEREQRLTYDDLYSGNPSICVYGQSVYVVWEDNRDSVVSNEIYFKHSPDNGLSWSDDKRITFTGTTQGCWSPSITVWDSFVHVVWIQERQLNPRIHYTKSADNGLSWSPNTILVYDSIYTTNPNICASGANVHLTWDEEYNSRDYVYYKRSSDGGSSWQQKTKLSNDSAMFSSLSVSNANVYTVWQQKNTDGTHSLYLKRSLNSGVTWEPGSTIITNSDSPLDPFIASSGSMLHVLWNSSVGPNNNEVNYKRSINGGVNWENEIHLSTNSENSMYPSLAVNEQGVHVIWTDIKAGIDGVFYKRNPTGNVGIKNISSGIAVSYELKQNYPNPFNPNTKIRFSIPSNAKQQSPNVRLKVYDIAGKMISELVNMRLSSGEYEVDFNASNLSSGIYFYELHAGDFKSTKKMILQK